MEPYRMEPRWMEPRWMEPRWMEPRWMEGWMELRWTERPPVRGQDACFCHARIPNTLQNCLALG